ncbi:YqaJ viral recombinase family protein [Leucobacter sp. NPDC058333]|uniref:YqaJ viral recombinase family protein n=1 Tax=Leucobacter sp. NPDC058333 TaxID=3346450 RepID=UPI0036522EFD
MSLTFTDLDPAPALVDLESRAGASDKDREAWLAERAGGVTATELAKIMIAPNRELAIADLVKKKREGDPFTGNAYTEWGNLREPVIAAHLAGYGVAAESRVFHAADNSRYLASPDGVSVDFDGNIVLDEIKTTGKPLPKGSAALAEKGYEWQMQWLNLVTGAIGCWLNVEMRHGRPGEFLAGELSREWFPRDEGMIAQLVEVADMVLAAMDTPAAPVINDEVDTHAVNYLRAKDEAKAWAELQSKHYDALVELGISQESSLARVTITPGKPATEFDDEVVDLAAAEAAHPKETAALNRAKARVAKLQAEWDALATEHKVIVRAVTKATKARATVNYAKGTK